MILSIRRAVALMLIVLTGIACSRTVEIPLNQIGEPEWRKSGNYRLHLVDGDEYHIRRFSVADSNVVVDEAVVHADTALYGFDNRPPKTIPIEDLRSVERIESRRKVLALYFGVVGAIMGFLMWKGKDTVE